MHVDAKEFLRRSADAGQAVSSSTPSGVDRTSRVKPASRTSSTAPARPPGRTAQRARGGRDQRRAGSGL